MADTPAREMIARLADGVSDVAPATWDGWAGSANPFVCHAFLSALERSGSVSARAGWQPAPIVVEGVGERQGGALPAYVKGHSQGEYVFDHAWADAWHRAGGNYYPKLQIAVPFSPVPGPRILTDDDETAATLIAAAEAVVRQNDFSSAHATFVEDRDVARFRTAGWLIRQGTQFHWANRNYGSFDDFLASLSSRKRKAIRKEREAANRELEIVALSGSAIAAADWDDFWYFYQDTGARKWGRPYLTRPFFAEIGATMADRLLLILARRNGRTIAGALNLIGADALYGRYWGCREDVPFLHFELCYYRAIDHAIAHGLSRVEAGAQGEHKLARGYEPVPTWSAHFIADSGFRRAVADFLVRERAAMDREMAFLGEMTPFRKG
jgi:hypothetical protein